MHTSPRFAQSALASLPSALAPPSFSSRILRVAKWLGAGLMPILFFLAVLRLGNVPSADDLDFSWRQVFAHAFAQNFHNTNAQPVVRFGTDLIFTYGPYGFANPDTPFDARLYPYSVWLQIALAAWLSLFFALFARRLAAWQQLCFWCSALALVALAPGNFMAHIAVALFSFVLLQNRLQCSIQTDHQKLIGLQKPFSERALFLLAATGLAFFALVKFSLLPLYIIWCLAVSAGYAQRARWGMALGVICVGALLVPAFWLLAQQNLADLPIFFSNSLEIARYYDETQVAGDPRRVTLLVIFVALSALCLITWRCLQQRQWLLWALSSIILFLLWKASIVRMHTHIFTLLGTLSVLIWVACHPILNNPDRTGLGEAAQPSTRIGFNQTFLAIKPSFWVPLLTTFICVLCWLAYWAANREQFTTPNLFRMAAAQVRSNIKDLTHLSAWQQLRIKQTEQSRDARPLPLTRTIVGNNSIDLFPHQQGLLLLNDFNYQPRPVMQSYSVYSKKLLEINRDYFASTRAPAFVLFQIGAIDDRFGTVDDALAIRTVLARYRPVLREAGFMLMQHTDWAPPAEKMLLEKKLRLGEKLDLSAFSERDTVLEVDYQPTLLGKIVRFIYRAPMLWMDCDVRETTRMQREAIVNQDNAPKEYRYAYRLSPAGARAGFIANPILANSLDLDNWLRQADVIQTQADLEKLRSKTTLRKHLLAITLRPLVRPWLMQTEAHVRLLTYEKNPAHLSEAN